MSNGVKNLLGAKPSPNTLKKITDLEREAYPNPLIFFKFGMYFAIILLFLLTILNYL